MRIRLDLRYDGSEFFGWAKQPGLRSVQEELELALAKVLPGAWGKPVPTVVAGRTDTGVHARHQVVHFDVAGDKAARDAVAANSAAVNAASDFVQGATNSAVENTTSEKNADFPLSDLLYRLSRVLPPDIIAFRASVAHPEFSARFWARERTYKYRICDDFRKRDPLRRTDVHWVKLPLSVWVMNRAIRGFTGLHDFATFVKPRKGATSIRNLRYFKFKRVRFGADKGLVVATLKADAFAYNMVRSLVGAAVLVGQGGRDVHWMCQCLEQKTRQGATGPIAAKGLTLERIKYIKHPEKASTRAQNIRQRRELGGAGDETS